MAVKPIHIIPVAEVIRRAAWHLVRKWATTPAKVRGEWLGQWFHAAPASDDAAVQAAYKPGTPCRQYYNLFNDPNQRRWRDLNGVEWMPHTPLVSDGGSTPKIARAKCKSWADLEPFGRHEDTFVTHDAGYRHAGIWVRERPEDPWAWLTLTRAQVDTILFWQLPSTGGRQGEVQLIFRSVRLAAGPSWRRHRRHDKERKE